MHDKNGNPLSIGDKIILTGTITEFTSDQPTYCNITMVSDEGMAPETPGSSFALSARMVLKGKLVSQRSVNQVQDALRGAASHIRDLRRAMDDNRRVSFEREAVLKEMIERLCNRGGSRDNCGAIINSLGNSHVSHELERLAASFDEEPSPTGTGPETGPETGTAMDVAGEGVVSNG